MTLALLILVAYLIGSVPFGYLVARARGVDIFKQGSGNIGATNVGRVLGQKFGMLVFVLDFAKGALPTLAARALGNAYDLGVPSLEAAVLAGLAAFVGHLFPAYLRFHGGKGVATGTGVLTVLAPLPTLLALVAWLAVLSATRYMSAASITGAVALDVAHLLLTEEPWLRPNAALSVFCAVVAAFVVLRHAGNIQRLVAGTETQLRDSTWLRQTTKLVHCLTVALWFGSAVFFAYVGLSLFGTFQTLGKATERPSWLPLPETRYGLRSANEKLDGPTEQGTRVAGAAVSPMFVPYFWLQTVCGALAFGAAWGWRQLGTLHRIRAWALAVGLGCVALGWWLEHEVHELRQPRNEAMEAYLRSTPAEREPLHQAALAARGRFGVWHMFSLFANFGAIMAVTVATGLLAWLPDAVATAGKDEAP